MSRARTDSGFSLVEALVALGVFAMAGVALVNLQTQSLSTFARVETRALADMAAQNEIAEIVGANVKPGIGAREQSVSFAGREWLVTLEIAGTADAATRRATIIVREPGAQAPAATAHAFFAAPRAGP